MTYLKYSNVGFTATHQFRFSFWNLCGVISLVGVGSVLVIKSTFLSYVVMLQESGRANGESYHIFSLVSSLVISAALGLCLLILGIWIYYVKQASTTMPPKDVGRAGMRFNKQIEKAFPLRLHAGQERNSADSLMQENWKIFDVGTDPVSATSTGYLQTVDYSRLAILAKRYDFVLRIQYRPGNFITIGSPIILVRPQGQLSNALAAELHNCLKIGIHRKHAQDIELSISELMRLAAHSLSQSVNDPQIAIACIDWLGAGLDEMYYRDVPTGAIYDEQDNLRALWSPVTHKDITNAAFNQIRQFARGNAAVLIRLLEVINDIAPNCRNAVDRATLENHAAMLMRVVKTSVDEPNEIADAEELYRTVTTTLAAGKPV